MVLVKLMLYLNKTKKDKIIFWDILNSLKSRMIIITKEYNITISYESYILNDKLILKILISDNYIYDDKVINTTFPYDHIFRIHILYKTIFKSILNNIL